MEERTRLRSFQNGRATASFLLLSRSPLALLLPAKSDDCAGHLGRRLDRAFEGDCDRLLRAIGWGLLPSELHFIAFLFENERVVDGSALLRRPLNGDSPRSGDVSGACPSGGGY